MPMAERSPSIRVEVETPEAQGQSGNGTPSPEVRRSKGTAVLVAAAAIGLVIVLLVVLRPDDGESADGSTRQAPTATTVAPVAQSDEADALAETSLPLSARLIDLETPLRGIVAAEVGYLSVDGTVAPRAAPPLLRSIDGVDWQPAGAEVVEPDDLDLIRSRFAAFVGLRSTTDGFTILRIRQQLAEPGRSSTGFVAIDRLVSDNGAVWVPDAQFTEVISPQAMPFASSNGDVLLGTGGSIPTTSARPTLAPTSPLASIDCSPRGSSVDLLFLENCEVPSEASTTDETTQEPDPCIEIHLAAVDAASLQSEFIVVDPVGPSRAFSARGLLTSPHAVSEQGAFAALTQPTPPPPAECDLTGLELPTAREFAIHIWEQPGEGTSTQLTDLDAAAVSESELATAVTLGAIQDGLLIATVDSLLRIDVTGAVERLGDFDSIDIRDGIPNATTTDDGAELLDIRDGVLRRWSATDNASTLTEEQVLEQSGFANVTHRDDNIIVTFSADGNRVVVLNNASR